MFLPQDQPQGVVLPAVARELGLPDDVPVYPGINDTQSGGMGTGAFEGDHGGLGIGTSGLIITHVDFKRTKISDALVSMPSPVPSPASRGCCSRMPLLR